MIENALAVALAYLVGAVPLGLVLGKLLRGIDIRDHGSGKIGATNVLRSVGGKAAVAVLVFDLGKGVVAVFIAKGLGDARYVEVLAPIAAVAGHNWSVFIRFTGGRGVNAGLGGLFALTPIWAAIALGSGLAVIAASRYVSLGSVTGAVFTLILMLVLAILGKEPWEYFAYTAVGVPVIIYAHRDNVVRLWRGEERRLGQKAEQLTPEARGAA
jgi:glycerol-3-phosphate acyltransferase PlsY